MLAAESAALNGNCSDLVEIIKCLRSTLQRTTAATNDHPLLEGSADPARGQSDHFVSAAWLRPIILVGHSYGGNVAIWFCCRHRHIVSGLVCIDGKH